MNEDLSKLIKQAYDYPEYKLSDDIWRAIELKQAKRLKVKALVSSSLGIISLVGFIILSISTKAQMDSSGFSHYLSLVFSDGSLITSFWKEYLLSLADSVPLASLGALSFLLFSTLISIRKTVSFYKNQLLKI